MFIIVISFVSWKILEAKGRKDKTTESVVLEVYFEIHLLSKKKDWEEQDSSLWRFTNSFEKINVLN